MKFFVYSYVLLVFKENNHIYKVHGSFKKNLRGKHGCFVRAGKIARSVYARGRHFFLAYDMTVPLWGIKVQ